MFQVHEEEEERIQTSKSGGRRSNSGGGVGGAQDGDGLGSSVGAGERLEVAGAEGRPPRFSEAVETWPRAPHDKDEL